MPRLVNLGLLLLFLCVVPGVLLGAEVREPSSMPLFELRDGDRVVFLGNTLIERAQQYGYWETMLTARWPERDIRFRNLGWDGDTVWAESRGIFDAPEKGYQRLLEHITSLKPTVIFLGYGNNEAFAGADGVPRFCEQYKRLLADLQRAAGPDVRFVILSPIGHEAQASPLPDATVLNGKIERYAAELKSLAAERGIPFVDLFRSLPPLPAAVRQAGGSYTSNGLHLNAFGYRVTAAVIARELGLASAADDGTAFTGAEDSPAERLRRAIITKNELYFHHWRPQNITYLFGFRKHEQGQNAKEVEEFEKLVAEKETEIARLRGANSN